MRCASAKLVAHCLDDDRGNAQAGCRRPQHHSVYVICGALGKLDRCESSADEQQGRTEQAATSWSAKIRIVGTYCAWHKRALTAIIVHLGWSRQPRKCYAAQWLEQSRGKLCLVQQHLWDDITIAALRKRRSLKWARYPADVLPAWVAEMDYPIAEPIRDAVSAALTSDDFGYSTPDLLTAAFCRWAERSWGWHVPASDVRVVADVVTGIAEILRVATAPGDRVVIDPPVYPPFAGTIRAVGREVVHAPLRRDLAGYALDLERIEAAYAAGAKVHLLCSPHNPSGVVHSRSTLAAVSDLASRWGVLVVSDEIHAPLTLPATVHVPFPMASTAEDTSIVVTSASKAWNIAGLKSAVMVATGPRTRALLDRLPPDLPYHAGHLGILGAVAAFDSGASWLDETVAILDRNRVLLGELLAAQAPHISWVPPAAGYLAWLHFGGKLADDPARELLARGRIALSSGPTFGDEGRGFARLNFATTRGILEEAVARIARVT